jgi:hypothetical protein
VFAVSCESISSSSARPHTLTDDQSQQHHPPVLQGLIIAPSLIRRAYQKIRHNEDRPYGDVQIFGEPSLHGSNGSPPAIVQRSDARHAPRAVVHHPPANDPYECYRLSAATPFRNLLGPVIDKVRYQ